MTVGTPPFEVRSTANYKPTHPPACVPLVWARRRIPFRRGKSTLVRSPLRTSRHDHHRCHPHAPLRPRGHRLVGAPGLRARTRKQDDTDDLRHNPGTQPFGVRHSPIENSAAPPRKEAPAAMQRSRLYPAAVPSLENSSGITEKSACRPHRWGVVSYPVYHVCLCRPPHVPAPSNFRRRSTVDRLRSQPRAAGRDAGPA